MNRGVWLCLTVVVFAGWGIGQDCQVRYSPPDYPELPAHPPQVYLSVTPNPLVDPEALTVRVWTSFPGATAWVQVRWEGAQLATRDVPAAGYAPPLNPHRGCSSVTATTRRLDYRDNGSHSFLAEALVYWKERYTDWSCQYRDSEGDVRSVVITTTGQVPGHPYYNCQQLRVYWQIRNGVVRASQQTSSYITWERSLSYDQVLQAFANRLIDDHKRAVGSMQAYAYAKEINDPVRGALQQIAQGYFYDCGLFCQRADPAGEIKILTDVPSILYGLLYTGKLCGGFVRVCFGQQNSRGADIGPKVEIKTFLMVKGWRHDYILLDRLIPRKYYDPSAPEYPGVPEDERQQVLQGCRVYKDTSEGRRCLALVETPTGITSTLKTLLMIEPMFQRGRQYP